jgi:hypothetical protein
MWTIEAKSFDSEGELAKYFYASGYTQAESREKHRQLSLSREWASVRSWSKVPEWAQEKSEFI